MPKFLSFACHVAGDNVLLRHRQLYNYRGEHPSGEILADVEPLLSGGEFLRLSCAVFQNRRVAQIGPRAVCATRLFCALIGLLECGTRQEMSKIVDQHGGIVVEFIGVLGA